MAQDGLVPDSRERRWLLDAWREADLIAYLMTHMEGAARVVTGSQVQPVVHPLVSELRQHRVVLANLLAKVTTVDPRDASSGTGRHHSWHLVRTRQTGH